MPYPQERLKAAIAEAAGNFGLAPAQAREVAFHMTDWLSDLEAWQRFCERPERLDSKALQSLLSSFLVHVPNHLAAAHKLFLGLPLEDVFELGVFDPPS